MKNVRFPLFPYDEYQRRLKKGNELMEKYGVDALVLTHHANMYYYAMMPFKTISADRLKHLVLFPRDREPTIIGYYVTANAITSYVEDVRDCVLPSKGRLTNTPIWFRNKVVETFKDLKLDNKVIGMDTDPRYQGNFSTPTSSLDIEDIKNRLPNAKFVDAADLIWEERMIKTDYEIGIIREACDIHLRGLKKTWESAKLGMTGNDLQRMLWQNVISEGLAIGYGGATIYGGMGMRIGREERLAGGGALGPKKLGKGDQIDCNGAIRHKYYFTDITRCASAGPIPEPYKKAYKACEAGMVAAMDTMKPGNRGVDVYNAAIKAEKEVWPETYPASQHVGHSIGLDSHEPPWGLAPPFEYMRWDGTLRPGMVMAVETPLCLPGKEYGVNLEDVVVITEDGCENLCKAWERWPIMIVGNL